MSDNALHLGDTTLARFHAAWSSSKLVIVAVMAEGPHAGKEVVCITPRANFRKGLPRAAKNAHSVHFLDSLRGAIRAQVLRGLDELTDETDGNFMDDLAILMAVKVTLGESALDGSGLFSIMLAVNPDEAAPWTERGFIKGQDTALEIGGQDKAKGKKP